MTVTVLVVGTVQVATADPSNLPGISAIVTQAFPRLNVRTVTVLDDRFAPPQPPSA
jgi:hypothetical protein